MSLRATFSTKRTFQMIDIYPVKEDFIHDFEYTEDGQYPAASLLTMPLVDGAELRDRCINYAAQAKNLEAEAVELKKAADAIYERMARVKKKSENIEHIIHSVMQFVGLNEISSSPYFKIKVKKNPAALDIFNPNDIPPEYKTEEVQIVIDRKQIKEDLKLGLWIPGASLESKTRLEIK